MNSGILKSKFSSTLFVMVVGSILTVLVFMAMVWFYYVALNFDSPVAATRVGLNVAIIIVSYIMFGGGWYVLAKSHLPDVLKAAALPVFVTVNIELVMDIMLATQINIPLFIVDGIMMLWLVGYCFIKKLPFFILSRCGSGFCLACGLCLHAFRMRVIW